MPSCLEFCHAKGGAALDADICGRLVECGIGESGLLSDRLGSSSENRVSSCRESEGTDRIVPFAPFVVRMVLEYSFESLPLLKEFILLNEMGPRAGIGISGTCL